MVVGAPALGEGDAYRVLVDGSLVQKVGVDGPLLVQPRLLVVKDGDDVSRGKLVHDEVGAHVEAPVQGGGGDEERNFGPVVHPHSVSVLIQHQTCGHTRLSNAQPIRILLWCRESMKVILLQESKSQ